MTVVVLIIVALAVVAADVSAWADRVLPLPR